MTMIVVNLFGGPNSGKSTLASGLFFKLKLMGVNCELIQEYAKDMTYEKRSNILADQLYILAKQNRRLERLRDNVDIAITDSLLVLGEVYREPGYYLSFSKLLFEIFNSYLNVNFRLTYTEPLPYKKEGRSQSEEEALAINKRIKHMLMNNLEYDVLPIKPFDVKGKAADTVIEVLKRRHPEAFENAFNFSEGPPTKPKRVIV